MHPRIGKRSKYNTTADKKECQAVAFIIRNTKKSLALKQEYLYLEDVKTALNIHHLEQNLTLKKWVLEQLKTGQTRDALISLLEKGVEKDRHRLQKTYSITL